MNINVILPIFCSGALLAACATGPSGDLPPPPPVEPVASLDAPLTCKNETIEIYYMSGGVELDVVGDALLDKVAEQVDQCTVSKIEIDAHSDSSGPTDLNLDIARQRGERIRDGLENRLAGSPVRIDVTAFGEVTAIEDDGDIVPMNRRVDIRIFSSDAGPTS